MIKIKLLLCLMLPLLTSSFSFAAAADSTKCESSKVQAQLDLKNKEVKFMLQGGFAPLRIIGQAQFEQKYHLKYADLGCVIPSNLCITAYNAEVAKYLDKKYGKRWRKEVWKGVTGI